MKLFCSHCDSNLFQVCRIVRTHPILLFLVIWNFNSGIRIFQTQSSAKLIGSCVVDLEARLSLIFFYHRLKLLIRNIDKGRASRRRLQHISGYISFARQYYKIVPTCASKLSGDILVLHGKVLTLRCTLLPSSYWLNPSRLTPASFVCKPYKLTKCNVLWNKFCNPPVWLYAVMPCFICCRKELFMIF